MVVERRGKRCAAAHIVDGSVVYGDVGKLEAFDSIKIDRGTVVPDQSQAELRVARSWIGLCIGSGTRRIDSSSPIPLYRDCSMFLERITGLCSIS